MDFQGSHVSRLRSFFCFISRLVFIASFLLPTVPLFSESLSPGQKLSVEIEGGLTVGRFDLPPGSMSDVFLSALSLRGGASAGLRVPLSDLWSYGSQLGLYSTRINDELFVDVPVGVFLQFGIPEVFLRLRGGYIAGNSFTTGAYLGGGIALGGLTINYDQVLLPVHYVRWGLAYIWPEVWTFTAPVDP